MTGVVYAFLFSSFFFFFSVFCPLRISLSVEWPDLSSYHPLNFYSSVYSDLVFVNSLKVSCQSLLYLHLKP